MAATVPTKEPLTIRAGDTTEWTKSIDDYKASDGWTLSYSFLGTGGTIDITSSADGDDHAISVAAATTTAYTAEFYDVIGFVEKGSDRYTVYQSRIEVLVDLVGFALLLHSLFLPIPSLITIRGNIPKALAVGPVFFQHKWSGIPKPACSRAEVAECLEETPLCILGR